MKPRDSETKRQREKALVGEMIALYCKKRHGSKRGLCPECQALLDYARSRSDKCPFMETKTLLQLPGALLQAGDAGEDPAGDGLCRAQDALCPPRGSHPPRDRDKTGTEKIGENR